MVGTICCGRASRPEALRSDRSGTIRSSWSVTQSAISSRFHNRYIRSLTVTRHKSMNPPNRLPAGVLATVLVVSALMLLSAPGRTRVVGVRFSVLLPRGLPLAATGERRVGLRSVRRRQHADSKARRAGRPAALRRPARQSGADRRPAMGTVRGRARRGGRFPNRSDPAVRVGRPLRMFAGRRKRGLLVCD